ncbi:MAG: DUF4177 domain-containing protein [Candidatus Hydrogenedentes bacterium]|nr:DUF4177 domain-containing protein [Candidatus Hydrogenedentota bacterium]
MRWEYKFVSLAATGWLGGKLDVQLIEKALNRLGRESWEAVSGFDTNHLHGETRDVHVLLKRSIS